MANLAASLPSPTPLRRGLSIHFQWGEQKFDIVASAASIHTVAWDETGEEVTWLHCKAIQVQAIKPDGECDLINCLIPAHYVTHAAPGPAFRIVRSKARGDLGIFPPTQPPPPNAIPLEELTRRIAELVDASIN